MSFNLNTKFVTIVSLFAISYCTNHSSSPIIINPPVPLRIEIEGTGHILTVAAQNTEIGFLGYRVYTGIDEKTVRAMSVDSGIDCSPFEIQPNAPVEYVIEIKENLVAVTPGFTNRICAIATGLTPGSYIAIRSLVFSVASTNTSDISNVLLIP